MNEKKQQNPQILMVVDIGGSKYMPGFVNTEGKILYQEKRIWLKTDEKSIVEQIENALTEICEKKPEFAKKCVAGGVTIPGFADPITGVWADSDFLIVHNLPICQILSDRFQIPFFADNDCNACALAERYFGGAKDGKEFLYLTVSTGIGGALYIENELYYGSFWHAGEIGLFVVEEDGRSSDTGSMQGIVEMYASGRGMALNYQEEGGRTTADGKIPGGIEISRLAKEGDVPALKTLELEGRYLGRVIANANAVASFEKVILGGGVSLMFEQYKTFLYQEFQRILPGSNTEIQATELGYTGAFLGAAAVAIRGISKEENLSNYQLESVTYQIDIDDQVRGTLKINGNKQKTRVVQTGEFLSSKSIRMEGKTLNQIIEKWQREEQTEDKLYETGYEIGKGLASACVLLDPEKIIINTCLSREKLFRNGIRDALVNDTYYRGNLPFEVVYKERTARKENEHGI